MLRSSRSKSLGSDPIVIEAEPFLARRSPTAQAWRMHKAVFLVLLSLPGTLVAQSIQTGRWDVTSTAVDLVIPGAPAFPVRMMKGKSKSERKCISSELASTGVAVLLAPDPKAQCHIDAQQIAGGRYSQALTCPQKQGPPIRITRTGTYDASGFAGRLDMSGQTPKGAIHMTLDQKAAHAAGRC
ncbi:DUF3617 domain-containing protein [Sphingomonas oryzagri]